MKFVSRFRWPHSRGCCCEGARIVHFRCDRCLSSFCTEVSIKINFMVKSFFNCFVMAAAAFHIKLFLRIYLSQNLQSTLLSSFFLHHAIYTTLLNFPGVSRRQTDSPSLLFRRSWNLPDNVKESTYNTFFRFVWLNCGILGECFWIFVIELTELYHYIEQLF